MITHFYSFRLYSPAWHKQLECFMAFFVKNYDRLLGSGADIPLDTLYYLILSNHIRLLSKVLYGKTFYRLEFVDTPFLPYSAFSQDDVKRCIDFYNRFFSDFSYEIPGL